MGAVAEQASQEASMRSRSIAVVAALVLAGMAVAAVSGAKPFDGGTATVACGDGTVTATPGRMWPPNHKLKTVTISYDEVSNDGDTIGLEIDSVTHDEEGLEKGATKRHEPDWVATFDTATTAVDDGTTTPPTQALQLRKERLAKPKDGREYSITVTCTDDDAHELVPAPTEDQATVVVCVPHTRKRVCA
jgi:hypothetical protein